MAKTKVTYTYNGITFSTASKVVAERAASGNLKGAYARYISDTVGRTLRSTGMAKKMRLQYVRAAEVEKLSQQEIRAKARAYQKEVRDILSGRVENQYQDVFSQLKDSSDPEVRKLSRKISTVIRKYSDRYKGDNAEKMNNEIKNIVDQARTAGVSEEGLEDLNKIDDSLEQIRSQVALREQMKNSRLKDRRK